MCAQELTEPMVASFEEETIAFSAANSTLARPLPAPSIYDDAEVLVVASNAALGATVGSDVAPLPILNMSPDAWVRVGGSVRRTLQLSSR
jgi:hypothetical protein